MGEEIVNMEKQAELCYQDTLKVIADAKQKLYDISKWIVTLQALVLGLSFSKNTNFSSFIVLLPIFIGGIGFALNHAISTELYAHRCTLANLRKTIGGLVYEVNKDHVDYFLEKREPSHKNYYQYYKNTNAGIVIIASLLCFAITLLQKILVPI